ncbi:DUF2254 family protein [Streptomyces sp. CA-249302]|uniref:DUF2254 family protein n=1 Tax=Streptomyces sp. CA-249302 TaxID=3240058 RepID=UPI003D94F8FE
MGEARVTGVDAACGFRLLADITVRALSPAVNDPTTAVQALDQIEDALLRLSDRPLGPAVLLDRVRAPACRPPCRRTAAHHSRTPGGTGPDVHGRTAGRPAEPGGIPPGRAGTGGTQTG